MAMHLHSKGPAVKQLQEELNKLNFDCGIPDGDFEEKTELAVKQFQKSKGLQDDGIAGPKTLKTLAVLFPIKPMRVKAPSGIAFDVIDSYTSDSERLKKFCPGQPVSEPSDVTLLPRFYIAINNENDLDQKLTDNFKLGEFVSDDERDNKKNVFTFPYFVPVAIVRLARALEELRTRLNNQPLQLSSGYRSPFYSGYLNDPDFKSAHRFGTAVDITRVGNLKAPSEALLNIVYDGAFDGHPDPGNRPSPSSLGFEYAESSQEIIEGSSTKTIDHAHLDMGFVSGYPQEVNNLGDLVIYSDTNSKKLELSAVDV